MAKRFEDDGVTSIIFTDIGRDGMMSNINVDATVALCQGITIPVIASGGLTDLEDVKALCAVAEEGIEGCHYRQSYLRRQLGLCGSTKACKQALQRLNESRQTGDPLP